MDPDAPPARVGLDGFNMAMPRGTGVATYGRMLSQAVGGLGVKVDVLYGLNIPAQTRPASLREVLFFDQLDADGRRKPPRPMSPGWWREAALGPFGQRAAEVPVTGRVVTTGFASRLPHHDRLLNVDGLFDLAHRHFRRSKRFLTVRMADPPPVMHWTYPLPIRLEGARNIYTLHDLVPLRLPYATLDNKRGYARLIRGCLRWGDHICTVSEASRRDILDLFPVAADKVTNTYQTAFLPEEVAQGGDLAGWLQRLFGVRHKEYLLYFGAIEPKKNLGRLIQAYLASGIETPLLVIGGRSWKAENETRLLYVGDGQRSALSERVRLIDYVPVRWLGSLVRGARAVLFPSLYEGFGLPVLEAMQLGVPVLTSTESSLPEVAGEAALLVNPYDTGALMHGLLRLDADATLRAALADAGLRQARRFDAAAYAGRVAKMYQGVMAAPS